MQVINNNIVYGGADSKFNERRILPPGEIAYPDMIKHKDFYKRIGCPHLELKYMVLSGSHVTGSQMRAAHMKRM